MPEPKKGPEPCKGRPESLFRPPRLPKIAADALERLLLMAEITAREGRGLPLLPAKIFVRDELALLSPEPQKHRRGVLPEFSQPMGEEDLLGDLFCLPFGGLGTAEREQSLVGCRRLRRLRICLEPRERI